MRTIGLLLLVTVRLALPCAATAVTPSCMFALSGQSRADEIRIVNTGGSDGVVFSIRDDAGAQQGFDVTSGTIETHGLFVIKVKDLYDSASVDSSLIKTTWIAIVEGSGTEMVAQVKTAGGATQLRQVDVFGGTSCD